MQSPRGVTGWAKIFWAPKYVLSKHTSVMMSIGRKVEIQGRHLTSCRHNNETTRRMGLSSRRFPSHTMSRYHGTSIPRLESTWGAMERYRCCSPNGYVENWKNAINTPCLHRIASGVLSMGPWVKVTLSNVGLGSDKGFRLIWGRFAGLSWVGTSAKCAHKMTHIL